MKVLTLLVKRKVCYTRNALFSPFLCKAFIVFDVGCIINCTLTSHVVHSCALYKTWALKASVTSLLQYGIKTYRFRTCTLW